MNDQSHSVFISFIRRAWSLLLTLLFVAVAVLLVWSGREVIASRANTVDLPEATQPLLVSVATLTLKDEYDVQRRFTGQLEAPQVANLSFEQGGTLSEVLVNDGDSIVTGQPLARLDNRTLVADVERLTASKRALFAQLELAKLTNNRQIKLAADGFASSQVADEARISLSVLRARIAETEAAILAANIRREKSEIKAPFSGAINSRLVDAGNTVAGGQAIVSVVEQSGPIFRVGLDPEVAAKVSVDDAIDVFVGGVLQKATVVSVLPQIDAATRTQTIRASLDDASNIVYGITGEALFTQTVKANGAWVPLSALEDGIRGLWTIKTLSSDTPATVEIEAVEILYANSEAAYVNGTFTDDSKYIQDGVHRVVVGQTVRVNP